MTVQCTLLWFTNNGPQSRTQTKFLFILCTYLFCTRGTRESKGEWGIAKERKWEQAEHIPRKSLYTLYLFIFTRGREQETAKESRGGARESKEERRRAMESNEEWGIAKGNKEGQSEHIPRKFLYTLYVPTHYAREGEQGAAKESKVQHTEHIPGKFLYTLYLFILHERESKGQQGRAHWTHFRNLFGASLVSFCCAWFQASATRILHDPDWNFVSNASGKPISPNIKCVAVKK
jgi:hypothetical protein